jgi:hypothetical protein
MPAQTALLVDGEPAALPVDLVRGMHSVTLPAGSPPALLLPEGSYARRIVAGADDTLLFADVYD